jgi:hypothetical protein
VFLQQTDKLRGRPLDAIKMDLIATGYQDANLVHLAQDKFHRGPSGQKELSGSIDSWRVLGLLSDY